MSHRPVLIDHDDWFSFILAQYLAEASGAEPMVLHHRNNTLEDLKRLQPTHLIFSPGPGHVENPEDFDLDRSAFEEFQSQIPILGVCLGHQGIAHHLGATVVQAPQIMHGKQSQVHHSGEGIFKDLPSPMTVMRYHSWVVKNLPPNLKTTATSEDSCVMAFEHLQKPIFGVQFHPESVGTENGILLLKNFFKI